MAGRGLYTIPFNRPRDEELVERHADTPIELRLLDQQRDRLSAAEAQGRDAALGLTFRHRVEQRDEHARADAPIGWPSAIAPPRTFTRSLEIPASLVHAAVTRYFGIRARLRIAVDS